MGRSFTRGRNRRATEYNDNLSTREMKTAPEWIIVRRFSIIEMRHDFVNDTFPLAQLSIVARIL